MHVIKYQKDRLLSVSQRSGSTCGSILLLTVIISGTGCSAHSLHVVGVEGFSRFVYFQSSSVVWFVQLFVSTSGIGLYQLCSIIRVLM